MNTNAITVKYSDEKLRILVEEYITMQKHEFTFKGLCSYVLYWAKEEGKTAEISLYASDKIDNSDCNRLMCVLERIVQDGRIERVSKDKTRFIKKEK